MSDTEQTYPDRSVTAELAYMAVPEEGFVCGLYAGQEDQGGMSNVKDHVSLQINDARELQTPPNLEDMGFELCFAPSFCPNLEDDDEIKKTYYPEVEQLVQRITGATRVIVFDHTARWTEQIGGSLYNLGGHNSAAAPADFVHGDYTDVSAPNRIRQLVDKPSYTGQALTPEDAEKILSRRYIFINVWRNTTENPVQRNPLTFCDATTVERSDIQNFELRYPDRIGANYVLIRGNEQNHKWYYFPEMTIDEAAVFKTYDSDEGAKTRMVFHTAFDHPETTEGTPPRHSIEMRTIACFD